MSTEEILEVLLSKITSLEKKIEALTENKAQGNLMNISEAATFLKRKPKTLYAYVSDGRIPHIKNEGKLLFIKTDLEAWLTSGKSATNQEMENRMISLNKKRK